jgi:hypothetical protein
VPLLFWISLQARGLAELSQRAEVHRILLLRPVPRPRLAVEAGVQVAIGLPRSHDVRQGRASWTGAAQQP